MKKAIIILLILAAVITGAVLGYNAWYQNNHVFVADKAYDKALTMLDLRGTGTSLEEYESLRQQLPECEIRYDLPFQGGYYPDDTKELTITSLTAEEVILLDYLPQLTKVDARECQDYVKCCTPFPCWKKLTTRMHRKWILQKSSPSSRN